MLYFLLKCRRQIETLKLRREERHESKMATPVKFRAPLGEIYAQ
jgi:hypothetical protein